MPALRPPFSTAAMVALAFGAAFTLAPAAQATLYKWVDANGRVVYSDQPPTGNVKTEVVNAPAPPSNPNAVKDLANKELEYKKQQVDRAEAQQKARDDRDQLVRKNEACMQARAKITQMGYGNAQILRPNDKGEMVVMSDAERAKEKQDLELWLRQNRCPAG